MPKAIITSRTAPTTGFTDAGTPPPIVQAIRFGNMLFVSGQGPLDPETKTVVPGGIEVQTRRTLENLRSVLEAAGATFANVVNMRVVLRDTADFPAFNQVFRDILDGEKVTRTCVGGTPASGRASMSRSTAWRCSIERAAPASRTAAPPRKVSAGRQAARETGFRFAPSVQNPAPTARPSGSRSR